MSEALRVSKLPHPVAWPAGRHTGILAGLGAGAFWGTTFMVPLVASGFSPVDHTVGRFLACGLFALLLMAAQPLASLWRSPADSQLRRSAAWRLPTARQALAALGLSVLGYTGHYLLLVLAIQDAGAALPVLIIGTLALWMRVLGKPQGLRWVALAPGLILTGLRMLLMMQFTGHGANASGAAEGGGQLQRGVLFALVALASWTALGLLNATWPAPLQLLACGLFLLGIVASVRAHPSNTS